MGFHALCACGHELIEHDPKYLSCDIDGCDCIYFEADEEPEDADR